MNSSLKKVVQYIMNEESSPRLVACSCAVGVGLAMSPLLGIQTVLAFGISWLLRLRTGVVILILCMVNNPFTMVPIIMFDYMVGYWICSSLGMAKSISLGPLDRFLLDKIAYLVPTIEQFSVAYYLIGGGLVAVVSALLSYPLFYVMCKRVAERAGKVG